MKYLDDALPNLRGVHLLPGRGAFGSKQGSLTRLHRAVAGCAVHVRPRAVTLCLRDAAAVHLEVFPAAWDYGLLALDPVESGSEVEDAHEG